MPATAARRSGTSSGLVMIRGPATAGLAMGEAGPRWLADLPGYEVAVITEDMSGFRSVGLPVVPDDGRRPAARPDTTVISRSRTPTWRFRWSALQ